MKRRIVSAWVALATVFFVLVGAQSAHASVVSTVEITVNNGSDWVTSTAVTPDSAYVFVTNYSQGSVSRVTRGSHTVQTVATGSHPYGVAVSPDGSTAAVANFGANTVSLVDVHTMSVTNTISVPGGPMGVAYSHDGVKLYVVAESSDDLVEIDATNRTVLNTTHITGSGWQASAYVAISHDNSKAYVTNIVGNSVSEISLTTHAVTRTFPGFNGARGLAISSGDTQLWVGNSDPGEHVVSRINLSTGLVDQAVTVGYGPLEMALSPDGSQLAVGQGQENSVALVNTQTFQVTQVAVGDPQASTGGNGKTCPWGVAYAPDGATLYVSIEYNGKLAALTLDPALATPNNTNNGGSGSSSQSGSAATSSLANTGAPALACLWALGALLTIAGASFVVARRRLNR